MDPTWPNREPFRFVRGYAPRASLRHVPLDVVRVFIPTGKVTDDPAVSMEEISLLQKKKIFDSKTLDILVAHNFRRVTHDRPVGAMGRKIAWGWPSPAWLAKIFNRPVLKFSTSTLYGSAEMATS